MQEAKLDRAGRIRFAESRPATMARRKPFSKPFWRVWKMGLYQKLRGRLDRAGIRPSTRRGQNFLLDNNLLGFIADAGRLSPRDVVLEVGPGSGFLTRKLALSGALVLAVELDHGLLPVAEEETRGLPNVYYLQGDI
ncbi:MAG: hypothetical protein LIP23_09065, partial [Planctomycetes bacterium]|nr:hypothetical protein [Planctomycetota bacterium]